MPSKCKSLQCFSHDPVTGSGLVWLLKIAQPSVVSLAIPLPLGLDRGSSSLSVESPCTRPSKSPERFTVVSDADRVALSGFLLKGLAFVLVLCGQPSHSTERRVPYVEPEAMGPDSWAPR